MFVQSREIGSLKSSFHHCVLANLVNDPCFSELFTKLCILGNRKSTVVYQNNTCRVFYIICDGLHDRLF